MDISRAVEPRPRRPPPHLVQPDHLQRSQTFTDRRATHPEFLGEHVDPVLPGPGLKGSSYQHFSRLVCQQVPTDFGHSCTVHVK